MNEQNLPIDIHTNKLLDWLVSRRHCSKNWQQSLTAIREKIKVALQDMPPNEDISKLLSGSYIDYYNALKIVEILKETEADSKNILGYYSSQRMKDWQEVIKLYEKESVYLAEAAQMLIRNVNYEVPSLKKQIIKCRQTSEECEKSSVDLVKQSHAFKNDYVIAAEKLGIKGHNIRDQLIDQLNVLPKMICEISKTISDLSPIRDYYESFLEFTLNKPQKDCLKLLNYLAEKGNTTLFEYRKGVPPEVIEMFNPLISMDDNKDSGDGNDQIDFGDDNEGIDFGDGTDTASTESPSTGNGDFVKIDKSDLPQDQNNEHEIAWDISSEPTQMSVIECLDENGRVARGIDALTVLEVAETRNLFIYELIKLEGFLDQRHFEMSGEDDLISSNQFQSAPPLLQLTSSDGIASMLAQVREVSTALTNPKMKVLYYMKDSPKYIENVIGKLKHIQMLGEKALNKSKLMEEKRLKCLEEARELEPKVPLVIEKTRDLQKKIESDISKRYKNRPVNIMGGVQVL